jgi:hypothetical protein
LPATTVARWTKLLVPPHADLDRQAVQGHRVPEKAPKYWAVSAMGVPEDPGRGNAVGAVVVTTIRVDERADLDGLIRVARGAGLAGLPDT